METHTRLSEIRKARGLSAALLAKQAGVSRQTIYSIEAGDYVPNTTVALLLARLLEVSVEELFSIDADPPVLSKPVTVDLLGPRAGKGQPVQLCSVGKRTVAVSALPETVVMPMADGVILEASPATGKAQVRRMQDEDEQTKRLLIAGCDPGIALLAHHLARHDAINLIVAPSSSRQALEWLKQGKVHVAGTHLRDAASGEYNLPAIRKMFPKGTVKVVTFAIWEQGLVMQPGNPKGICGIEDLARKGIRIINREKGAGSRELLDEKLRDAGIDPTRVHGYDSIASGHLAAALAVSQHDADCCVATRSAARAFGLSFVPLATERYDLAISRQHVRLAAVQALLDGLNRSAIRRRLELLAGYDTSRTGNTLLT